MLNILQRVARFIRYNTWLTYLPLQFLDPEMPPYFSPALACPVSIVLRLTHFEVYALLAQPMLNLTLMLTHTGLAGSLHVH